MKRKYFLAIDIGASSGRHIVGYEDNGKVVTEEVYRFPNGTKTDNGRLVWDTDALYESVLSGIKAAFVRYPDIQSLAIDTWGVDYVLLDGDQPILPCFSYRDTRTVKALPAVHSVVPYETLYKKTGIQFQPFNTIYQLYDDLSKGRLQKATDFLMLPEYLNYRLTGVKMKEFTDATTTGLVNAETGAFDDDIIRSLNFPAHLFKKLVPPGTVVGNLLPDVAAAVGGQTTVVTCASHDTASAVEGIPMDTNQPYISSGTWSLLGIKTEKALTDDVSRKENWSNEGGIGYVRYQKNIMGLWLVQRLQKELCPEKSFSQIAEEASLSDYTGYVDVDAERFFSPESMVKAFDSCFEKSERPKKDADYFRCAYVSLAFGYKKSLEELQKNIGGKFDALYIVGGGAKNKFLNKLTEDYCKIKVIALPIEATAIGNLKIQIERGK